MVPPELPKDVGQSVAIGFEIINWGDIIKIGKERYYDNSLPVSLSGCRRNTPNWWIQSRNSAAGNGRVPKFKRKSTPSTVVPAQLGKAWSLPRLRKNQYGQVLWFFIFTRSYLGRLIGKRGRIYFPVYEILPPRKQQAAIPETRNLRPILDIGSCCSRSPFGMTARILRHPPALHVNPYAAPVSSSAMITPIA